ncbi:MULTISPECIES: transglutaminase family protein [unclassified Novosphingobium]|uniref:transglutaminase-like domain-containing protein n=1 Tax=unclassified Novosphingobium TaxID=2644732 RepID=UPI0006C89CAC|nr:MULTISPECIES: transglutaminase family protein [unclassified Novosphingobium]KPH60646.1 transglutaminase [Novosphingobium sp. ST904]MPS67870.1 transglutaminase family protein [Novosphingobium sp.]TCM39342.1 transglutaminase-like putative cysteine protease [Novosphingobium sp. ST904]
MKLSILAQLDYALPAPTDVLLQLEAAILPEQVVHSAHISLPPVEHFARLPGHDQIGDRIWLHVANALTVRYEAVVEPQRIVTPIEGLPAVPPHMLPAETVDYLLPSRFCPSDTFQDFALTQFGMFEGGNKVAAIRDWVAGHLAYVPGSSNAQTSAADSFNSGEGVCRDYAHLVISLCRASAIPARFASVYGLGVKPQDFHAVAEVFLDDTWHLVDATGMSRPEAMAKIGVGVDAAAVSFLTSYGPVELRSQSVEVREIA